MTKEEELRELKTPFSVKLKPSLQARIKASAEEVSLSQGKFVELIYDKYLESKGK